ncbi:carboxylating nicotinate-nucleotide diphosphorylase [Anaerotalea alkaliphila]|uniref:Probable nicotinate-nucleotide pyrophosphorylase [carboxylating] n=1 Tax=Anaerotalea alkaliphila TaxID=2662126 RepID=A0A7X5HXC2_9FIRM|nr:carboxylating nicotinate-nucleotide diphosphorylase [Anaerotalea alkaliphila]NDL68397.1 carboxylating nicotinate-nucleotide diphosphorylase [Anaerotalea alkaliphila]
MLLQAHIDRIIQNALDEDVSYGDITTQVLLEPTDQAWGRLLAKEAGTLSGLGIFVRVFALLDPEVAVTLHAKDGERVEAGACIAHIQGPAQAILTGERTALNILQRMSGIATATRALVDAAAGTKARIVDTRKTAPGLRILDKAAVLDGGGRNHRFNLSDAVMIKDNHSQAVGGIRQAVAAAREKIPHTMKVEVEAETLEQVAEALEAGADIIMLDNMDLPAIREAVALIGGRALVEASGNVTLERVRELAATGVDVISCGAITHSVKAMDISLKF